ncbi:Rv3654c family TadE-like protein [Corynebacterium renale]|uniref:Secretion/DNA translocation related TadE-like protein n=1 Tax=Corynebacterium renale TaxID=1724 RepID=A0A2A9DNF0_9CORY|nr:Rv3654c family TadE-like protein [Corynebacterium renale]PFG27440.1 secretion/DNA translocation related TadE-like protein [Corynebacterium renale]SQI23374.1 putative secreted protein [Corynebacterium renale]
MRSLHDDTGSATITAAGMIAALVLAAMTIAGAAHWVVAGHRAQVAADMAAVAAAYAHAVGREACPAAEATAHENQATVTACAVDGADVEIRATISGRDAVARAGPL